MALLVLLVILVLPVSPTISACSHAREDQAPVEPALEARTAREHPPAVVAARIRRALRAEALHAPSAESPGRYRLCDRAATRGESRTAAASATEQLRLL